MASCTQSTVGQPPSGPCRRAFTSFESGRRPSASAASAALFRRPSDRKSTPISHLPNPYPPLQHPPFLELSYNTLGWLLRCARAVGSDRFDETVHRVRFYLQKVAAHAGTPADTAVIDGMAASLAALIDADADARRLLADSVSGIADACADEVSRLLDTIDGA